MSAGGVVCDPEPPPLIVTYTATAKEFMEAMARAMEALRKAFQPRGEWLCD